MNIVVLYPDVYIVCHKIFKMTMRKKKMDGIWQRGLLYHYMINKIELIYVKCSVMYNRDRRKVCVNKNIMVCRRFILLTPSKPN